MNVVKSGVGVWTPRAQPPLRPKRQFHDQQRGTVLAVKQAFTTMLLAKAALKVAQDNLKNYNQQLDIFRARYHDGDLGKIDFERLDLQLAQYESDEATAEIESGPGQRPTANPSWL